MFLRTLGNTLADSEVDELIVKDWGWPGITIGYHLNPRLHVGYAFQPNRNLVLKEPWTFGEDVKDGNIVVDHNTGTAHSLEGRYFPFKFDLYAAVFLTHVTKAKYNMDFDMINTTMVIGQNSYATDIYAEWNFKSLSTIGIGLGYNFVHRSGLSFDIGLGVPIALSAPFHRNISLQSIQGVTIDQTDLESAKRRIEDEMFFFPIQFHFNLGYNLPWNK
ncbi:hypothetical protein [Marinoscillum sp. MHG1-6]|uniref:hypothetical protein n=1 Tax=Marinoscillum sp. MHG1-6 TaxID=2959627 RepID=UPI002157CF87|nr:hypothetical protein [Marinoscillum sp. MHG1-6]